MRDTATITYNGFSRESIGKSQIQAPVFILGCHKSGTTLLRNLLDGHPSLFAYPRETHFLEYADFPFEYALRRPISLHHTPPSPETMVTLHLQYDTSRPTAFGPTAYAEYNRDNLNTYIRQHGMHAGTLAQTIDTYLNALCYGLTEHPIPLNVRIVEKTVEHFEYATMLDKIFPGSKHIHILRNPYATLTAIRKASSRNNYARIGRAAMAIRSSFYYAERNTLELDQYLVVNYEDLVARPEPVMRSICDFLVRQR